MIQKLEVLQRRADGGRRWCGSRPWTPCAPTSPAPTNSSGSTHITGNPFSFVSIYLLCRSLFFVFLPLSFSLYISFGPYTSSFLDLDTACTKSPVQMSSSGSTHITGNSLALFSLSPSLPLSFSPYFISAIGRPLAIGLPKLFPDPVESGLHPPVSYFS